MSVNFYERASHVVRGCPPMMGGGPVVRNAESGPASGCCGCVVGRVVEVESIGVRGCTRCPVLDFPTVGVIVAACAGPATSVAPSWQVAPRRVVSPRGFRGCAPMMGGAVVVRNAESGGAVLVEVDERAVFGCCSPRSKTVCVNVYETRRPDTQVVSVGHWLRI